VAAAQEATPAESLLPQGAAAQLVGTNVISCLFDPGYSLIKYLPILFQPGNTGVPTKRHRSVTGASGEFHPTGRLWCDQEYIDALASSFQFLVSYHGETVEGFHMLMWKGVRMNGLDVVAGFTSDRTEAESAQIWRHAYYYYGETSKPQVTVASGLSGWTAVETGWQHIARPEARVTWVATTDTPSYPKDDQPNEAAVLLMVAHPRYDAGRTPLVYFSAPVVVPHDRAQRQPHERPRIAALRQAAEAACAACGIEPKDVGALVTDNGRGGSAGERHAEALAGVGPMLAHLDPEQDHFDQVARLGPLGANTATYSLVLGTYLAHMRNKPVLYVSNVDSKAARAMMVLPPLNHTPPAPKTSFRLARSRGQWYAPWWGKRLDGKKDYAD
jgi:hypothetical protein